MQGVWQSPNNLPIIVSASARLSIL